MNIFSEIAPDNHYDTISAAIVALVQRAQSLSLLESNPWSLVELSLDEEDYIWLCRWATALSPAVVKRCLLHGQWQRFTTEIGNVPYPTAIGALLFLFSVEVARRHASERVLWSVVSNQLFSSETRRVLFTQNHPIRAFKDAIELAARWLNVRHVFGIAGLQNWYDTLYLQFGFTRAGFRSRLAEWLAGQVPTFAIQQLLNGPMRSDTFCTLWQALSKYRRLALSEGQVRLLLRGNPWIVQDWLPELLQQAKARPYLSVSSTTDDTQSSLEDSIEPFLRTPQLSWDTFGKPTFTTSLIPDAIPALTNRFYDLLIADEVKGQLRLTIDGSYQLYPPEISLSAQMPLTSASIVSQDGRVVQSQTLQLWDEGEDISAFSTTGKIFDPWMTSMSTKKSYYLLLASDLVIQPQPTAFYHLTEHTRLYFLEPDWSPHTSVFLEGTQLWQPQRSTAAVPHSLLKSQEVQVALYDTPKPLEFLQSFRLAIRHPEQYQLLYIRIAGQTLGFEQHTRQLAVTQPHSLHPQLFSLKTLSRLDVSLGFEHRETHTIERILSQVELSIMGISILEHDGWRVLQADQPLNIARAQQHLIRFYLKDAPSWSLFEGTTWITTVWQRPRPLQSCTGYGAPLKIQKSIYNANVSIDVEDRPQQLITRIIDTGCVKTISITGEAERHLNVYLQRAIEPDPAHHTIVWWDKQGFYQIFQPARSIMHNDDALWSLPLPISCIEPVAIGIAYDSEWIGSWFDENWTSIYSSVSSQGATVLAALLRWFHLPLLDQFLFDHGKQFAHQYASEVLPTWLSDTSPLEDLSFTDSDEGWLSVIRSLYFDWWPSSDIQALVKRLTDSTLSPLDLAQQLVWQIGRVCPILMAKIVRAWMLQECVPQWGTMNSGVLLRNLFFTQAEADNGQQLAQKKRALEQELVAVMQVDQSFLKKALIDKATRFFQRQPMDPTTRRNIAVAMHVEPFRRLLSIYLLELIYGEIEGKRSRT